MSDDTRLLFESYEIWAVVSIKPVGPLSPREFGVAVSMFGGTNLQAIRNNGFRG
jgi:hypothetical protein